MLHVLHEIASYLVPLLLLSQAAFLDVPGSTAGSPAGESDSAIPEGSKLCLEAAGNGAGSTIASSPDDPVMDGGGLSNDEVGCFLVSWEPC